MGGADALRQFRARLHQHGLALVLDFVPNHLGLDHPWLAQKTDLFVSSLQQRPETFPVASGGQTRWVAHAKDPYFPAWTDTAQLDYRRPETRQAMIAALQSVAAQCDGVRCDMAMLLLNDVFARTWAHFPAPGPPPATEFWAEAIAAIKERHPDFVCIAEVYWDLESRLRALGFDYLYDKKFYDFLTRRDWPALQDHVRAAGARFPPVRFLENHDEPPIASLLNAAEQKARRSCCSPSRACACCMRDNWPAGVAALRCNSHATGLKRPIPKSPPSTTVSFHCSRKPPLAAAKSNSATRAFPIASS